MTGFCFPTPLTGDAETFWEFVGAPPGRVLNPWPQLVDRTRPGFAWSQPLIRAYYLPTVNPTGLEQAVRDGHRELLPMLVAHSHETFHIMLDQTPAKRLARIHSSLAYERIAALMETPGNRWQRSHERHWQALQWHNAQLDALAQSILLEEELLATSLSFWQVGLEAWSDEMQADLANLEQAWVAKQAELIGPLFAQCYRGIRHLWTLAPERDAGRWAYIARIASVLEAVYVEESEDGSSGGEVVRDICADFARNATAYTKTEDVLRWVEAIWNSARDSLYFENWSDTAYGTPVLLDVKRARTAVRAMTQLFGTTWEHWLGDPSAHEWRTDTVLFPRELFNRWFVLAVIAGERDERYLRTLVLESLRQQLASGQGFACPVRAVARQEHWIECICGSEPLVRERVRRFAEWAFEGRFGEGDWMLPDACAAGDDA